MSARGMLGAIYSVCAVIALVSYLAAGHIDTHVGDWQTKVPRHDKTCVIIEFDNKKDRHILDHAWDAIQKGAPKRLHIDRGGADENRAESLSGTPTKHGYDRDEYPPAMSSEGGEGTDVRYVRSKENRRAGKEMGEQLRGYKDGDCFQFEGRPK